MPSAVPMALKARPAKLVTQSVSSLVARLRTSRLRWQGRRGEDSQQGWFWPQVVDGGGRVSPSGVPEEVVELPRPTGELNPATSSEIGGGQPAWSQISERESRRVTRCMPCIQLAAELRDAWSRRAPLQDH